MREFAFELALSAHLEAPDRLVGRQIGGAVHGRRVLDTVVVEPGAAYDERAALSAAAVPAAVLDADLGSGEARFWREAFDCHPDRAREAIAAGVERGILERERRNGRTYVRLAGRYPERWFDEILAVENKPDLDRPGDLERQVRVDVSLGVADRVVVATASHVTGAHLNRLPDPVGIWRFDPERGERTVVREATPLPTEAPGVEPVAHHPGRTDVRVVDAEATRRTRRQIAERVYGRGWRTVDYPACARCEPTEDGRPHCSYHDRAVRVADDCGADCPGHEAADPPDVDRQALRAARSAWDPDRARGRRRQSGLERYQN